jgi:ABC-type multidrug transport system permease subunit
VLFWSFAFPVLMAWGLGIAFSNKGEIIRNIAVINNEISNSIIEGYLIDSTSTRLSNEGYKYYTKVLGNEKTGTMKYNFFLSTWDQATLMLKRGKAGLVIENTNEGVQYHFDPLNPEAYLAYMQLSNDIEHGETVNTSNIKPLTQKGTRYVDFLVPGLIAMGIMMSAMWGVSYNLIDKRSKKLLRRMVATPMNKSLFLFSHFISRSVLSLLETLVLVIFVWWYFAISIEGSIMAFISVLLAGNLAFVGLAVFVSSRTSNTQIGNGLINLIVMPMMIGSGIFFSYHNFPEQVIPFIQSLPLTMMADGIRSVFIEGAGFKELWNEILILCGAGIAFFMAGLKVYKWY